MNANKIIPFIVVIAIVIFSACSSTSNPNPHPVQPPIVVPNVSVPTVQVQVNEPPANTGSSSESSGACNNPYLPVILNATWNYKLTGAVKDTFTHTILSVESNSFVGQDVFDTGVTRQVKWNCENGNLIALNPPSGASANVSTENNVSADFETKDSSGVTLPATINTGDTWSQSLTLEGTQTINGTAYPASNQHTSDCKAIGLESVTVEAGTFDTLHVECHTTMKLSLMLGDTPTENTLNVTETNWYAQGVGLVKSHTVGFGFDNTVELVSYNIP